MNPIHNEHANGKWFDLTLAQQLGNIGSEIGRAVKWQEKGKLERSNKAIERAFELLQLTISDQRWQGSRLRELCRVKEILADTFFCEQEYNINGRDIEKYFFNYALAARSNL